MKLEDLGYTAEIEQHRQEQYLLEFDVGRIIAEHKERYVVSTGEAELEAEVTGNLRFTAKGREDFPAVGDWVALISYDAEHAIIHQVLPRSSMIKRQSVSQVGEVQVIAANIDHAFIIMAADRDFNLNRMERYLTICHTSGIDPMVVISKIDLVSEARKEVLLKMIRDRVREIPVIAISNETHAGYEELTGWMKKGKTYCLLGSSGVGKSSLVNHLSGTSKMKTDAISQSTQKGRHVTSHREMTVLENGGILIDNPGMREVGIADASEGLETTFSMILDLANDCRFSDCTHTSETGCAVLKALENEEISGEAYENYLRMERERAHFESTVAERRKKDKEFGKMVRNVKDHKKRFGNK